MTLASLRTFSLVALLFLAGLSASAQTDTLTNRYATAADAATWPTVNEGDFLIFSANNLNNTAIYYRDDHPSFPTIATTLGKKILIWRGDYSRIYIEGGNCENTEAQPTIITNFGGQVRVGHNPDYNYRSLHLVRFDHLYLTGKHDPAAQTGDPAFKGHDAGTAMGSGDYYEKYGIWAYPRFIAERTNQVYDNSVRASYFQTLKIDYVASFGGGFACFNLKSEHPPVPGRVKIDVQDCFAGFCRGEGFYIGKTGSFQTADINELILRNNIVVAAGAESFQTGVLGAGSLIEHNVGLFSGSYFRRPFQKHQQDHGHQLTWVEGDIRVQNNLVAGVAGHPLMVFWVDPGSGRANPSASKPLVFDNNYYGFARTNLAYMNNTQDSVTPIFFQDNLIGPISTPATRDGYTHPAYLDWNVFARLRPCPNPLTVTGNSFTPGRPLFDSCYHNQQLTSGDNLPTTVAAPEFADLGFPAGFDFRNLTIWSAKYEKVDLAGQYIPYAAGDIVFFYDTAGHIRFYECLLSHAGDMNPTTSPSYWQQMTWNGRAMPPLDVRLVPGSEYEGLDIGLTYDYVPPMPDTTQNRYATYLDAAYWPTVNEGDFLIFSANNLNNTAIYYRDDNPAFPTIATALGKKIMIWRGDYSRIYLEGGNCANSASQPTIITNFGGQVKVAHNPDYNYRSLHLVRFEHLYLTGKYDPVAQTGDPAFKGHDGGQAMASGDYYEKYGIWAYPRFVGERTNQVFDNSVRAAYFQTLKIDYVASFGGGFACFNLKSDNQSVPGRVKVDVQDCFAGFSKGEGFYIGKTGGFETGDIHELTLRNNIVVAAGAESFQTGVLGAGSVVEHNVGLFSGAHFRRPFQKQYQDNGIQLTWVEGGVTLRDNLILGVPGTALNVFWIDPGSGRANPSASQSLQIENNYFGFVRNNLAYLNNTQDAVTPIVVEDNVAGPISTPSSRDGYTNTAYLDWNVYARLRPCPNPLTVSGNQFPMDRPLFDSCYSNQNIQNSFNTQQIALVPEFMDVGFPAGFDYRNLTFWSAKYDVVDLSGQYIPYQQGDLVYYFNADGHIRFFECVQAHAGDMEPNSSSAYWQEMSWNGRPMPPLDVRLVPGDPYEALGMGLTYGATAAAANAGKSGMMLDPYASQVEVTRGEGFSETMLASYDPVEEMLVVELPGEQPAGSVQVMTLLGELVAEEKVAGQTLRVPAGTWATGIYLLKWSGGTTEQVRKVLIRN